MPRKSRFFLPNIPVHAIQRGNNRQAIFFDEVDYRLYLGWLKAAAEKYGCQIHAYVLMTNHVHLLITPEHRDSLSRLFQYVGRYYVTYVNNTYGRTGTLWEGRYKASIVEEDRYLLSCYRYIELNPVRAGMVKRPEDYPWSSYGYNALAIDDRILSPHKLYLQLGEADELRQCAYQALFQNTFDAEMLDEMRACLQSGTPLGSGRFKAQIEQVLKVKVGQAKRGRPRLTKV
jgi:putative transposase